MAIYFWKYQENTRSYPGFHLSVDGASVDALISSLRLQTQYGSMKSKRYELAVPTKNILSVPNNRRHKAFSKEFLTICCDSQLPCNFVEIDEKSGSIDVMFSVDKLSEFCRNIEGLVQGKNDFSMSGSSADKTRFDIWFW